MASNPAASTSFQCSIAPWLSVRNGAKAVDFYKTAFGAVEAFRLDGPDGGVVARLSVDGAEFWLGDESPQHQNFSPQSLGGGTVRMVLTVADPDAVRERCRRDGKQRHRPQQSGCGPAHGGRSDFSRGAVSVRRAHQA